MIGVMGEEYTETLRNAYHARIPAAVDLVCYWFAKAWQAIGSGAATRAGLVATQAIRKGSNRQVLDSITETGVIYAAWCDEPWSVDGAAVRVSLVCFAVGEQPAVLDGKPVALIHADLTGGASNLTTATRLSENLGISFQGPVKVGSFEVPGETARSWLNEPLNVNGRPNSDVVRPWAIGRDITSRWSDSWITDFASMAEAAAAGFVKPFAHVIRNVKPDRERNRDRQRRQHWWLLGRSGAQYRQAVAKLSRYIATPETSKHRIFVWLPTVVFPEHKLYVIARDDETSLGVLHSRFHELWSLATAGRHGVGNDPRYSNTRCFETFPFPEHLTPNLPAASYADNPHAQAIAAAARELVEKRDLWLNPPDLVERVPEVVPGFPDRIIPRNPKAAAILKTRTLTHLYNMRGTPEGTWLDNLHHALDEAVAAAYGWPADLSDDDILSRLLDLNRARAAGAEGQGTRDGQERQTPLRVDPSRPAA